MILLIAYGNPLRQDDGAGLRLAELMARRWQDTGTPLRHVVVQQLTPELAVEIADRGVTAVVFVDTRAVAPGDATAGAADAVTVTPLAAPSASSPSLGHHFQPDVLLAYAALLLEGRPAPPVWLVTVPGAAFDHGEDLSQTAGTAIETACTDHDQPLTQLMHDLAASIAPKSS